MSRILYFEIVSDLFGIFFLKYSGTTLKLIRRSVTILAMAILFLNFFLIRSEYERTCFINIVYNVVSNLLPILKSFLRRPNFYIHFLQFYQHIQTYRCFVTIKEPNDDGLINFLSFAFNI